MRPSRKLATWLRSAHHPAGVLAARVHNNVVAELLCSPANRRCLQMACARSGSTAVQRSTPAARTAMRECGARDGPRHFRHTPARLWVYVRGCARLEKHRRPGQRIGTVQVCGKGRRARAHHPQRPSARPRRLHRIRGPADLHRPPSLPAFAASRPPGSRRSWCRRSGASRHSTDGTEDPIDDQTGCVGLVLPTGCARAPECRGASRFKLARAISQRTATQGSQRAANATRAHFLHYRRRWSGSACCLRGLQAPAGRASPGQAWAPPPAPPSPNSAAFALGRNGSEPAGHATLYAVRDD